MDKLLLYHQLLLLALNNQKGSVIMSAQQALPFGLAGAVILELYQQQYIDMQHNIIVKTDKPAPAVPILAQSLEQLFGKRPEMKIKKSVERLSGSRLKLHRKIQNELVQMGILQVRAKKFIFIPYKRYPELNPLPELDIRENIKSIVLHNSVLNEKTHALLSLIRACNLVNEIFARENRKNAKKRIKELVKQEPVGQNITKVVQEINAAIAGAVVASTAARNAAIHG